MVVTPINISIGGIVVKRLSDYIHKEDKGETYQRTLGRKLLINRSVNIENQPITKYHFEIPGVEDEELFNIRVVALKKSDLYLIDYYEIPEVLSGHRATKTFWLQRQISTTTGMVVKVNGVEVSPTITLNDNGRGKLVFTVAPTDADDNIVVRYVPKYLVHATLWDRTYIYNGLLTYILICEEV